MKKNKFGLSRKIPSSIEKIILKRLGFTCLFCSSPIVDFHHHKPNFNEAKIHDPNKIVILCPNHHRMFHAKFITDDEIEKAESDRILNNRNIAEIRNVSFTYPILMVFGAFILFGSKLVLSIENLLSFNCSINSENNLNLNFIIFNLDNSKVIEIESNILRIYPTDLEFKLIKNIIKLKSVKEKLSLEIEFCRLKGIIIRKVEINREDFQMIGNLFRGKLFVKTKNGINFDLKENLVFSRSSIIYKANNRSTIQGGSALIPIDIKKLKLIEKMNKVDLESLVSASSDSNHNEYVLNFLRNYN